MVSQWASALGLVWINPPAWGIPVILIALKSLCLALMSGLTLYGTLSTWPKLQLSSDTEAFGRYRFYIVRAYVTLSCGMAATALGVVLNHFLPRNPS
jgi:hypothetical protein